MISRAAPHAPSELAFTTSEIEILNLVVVDKPHQVNKRTISHYTLVIEDTKSRLPCFDFSIRFGGMIRAGFLSAVDRAD